MKIEHKVIGGMITETKQEERNGIPVGIIAGYIATWDVDRGDDRFVKGAFIESIAEHKKKNRQLRFLSQHRKVIGGFPIETVKEDDKGLFGIGEVNLNTQEGKEVFSLAKQGVLVDFSIGFSATDWERKDGIRVIDKSIAWEGSIVDEPMNTEAQVTEVKAIALDDFSSLTDRELEAMLSAGVKFSGKKAKIVISALKAAGLRDGDSDGHRDGAEDWSSVMSEFKRIKQMLEDK